MKRKARTTVAFPTGSLLDWLDAEAARRGLGRSAYVTLLVECERRGGLLKRIEAIEGKLKDL